MKRMLVVVALSALAAAACSSGGGTERHATCKPSGTSLRISAQDSNFDTDCLAAPANTPFTIRFDNRDGGTAHNVDIMTSMDGDSLFKGELITGEDTVTYHVHALRPGTYHFHCDVHPDMEGTFIVE